MKFTIFKDKIWLFLANESLLLENRFKETRLRNYFLRKLGFKIGRPVIIDKNLGFYDPKTIFIGNCVLIRENCYLDHHTTIEDFCTLSRDVMILTAGHNPGDMSYEMEPVIIHKFVWVGARATILPGVEIGEFSVIAAGAVVSRSVPPHTLAGGVPAKIIKELPTPAVIHNQFGKIELL